MGPASPQPQHLLSIHYLRAIAAIMVVVYHVSSHQLVALNDPGRFEWLKHGVGIFFVISGFVMVSSTAANAPSPPMFMLCRVQRIVPLYWIGTFLAALSLPAGHLDRVLTSLFFIPTIDPVTHSRNPILDVGWTLNFEMAFYALFAVTLYLPRNIAIALLAAFLVILSALPVFGTVPALLAGYASPALLNFAAGMLIAHFSVRLPAFLFPIGFALLAFLPLVTDWRPIAVTIPAILIVSSAYSFEHRLRDFRLPRLLGDASYAIYLFHMAAINFIASLWGHANPVWMLAPIVIASVGTGVIVYLQLERPLARWVRGLETRIRTMRAKPSVPFGSASVENPQ